MKKLIAAVLITASSSTFAVDVIVNKCFDAGIYGFPGEKYKQAKAECEFLADSMRTLSNESAVFITKCQWDTYSECRRNNYPGTGSDVNFHLNVKIKTFDQ